MTNDPLGYVLATDVRKIGEASWVRLWPRAAAGLPPMVPVYLNPFTVGNAKEQFDEIERELNSADREQDPVERLRFYCSLALSGPDWLDVEPFFDAVVGERLELWRQLQAADPYAQGGT